MSPKGQAHPLSATTPPAVGNPHLGAERRREEARPGPFALCPGGRLCGGRTQWPPVADLAWGLGFTCSWNQSLWIFLKRKVHQLSPEHGHFSNWENMQFSAPRKRHRGGSIAERAPSKSSLGWRPRRQLAPSPRVRSSQSRRGHAPKDVPCFLPPTQGHTAAPAPDTLLTLMLSGGKIHCPSFQ